PDYLVTPTAAPNDPDYLNGSQWGLHNTGQTLGGTRGTPGADIEAEPAWSVATWDQGIVVAVVDSGVDYTNPELAPNIWSVPAGQTVNGCTAGTHGYDAHSDTCDPMAFQDHGTRVAGIIGEAGNNASLGTGVAWRTSI